MVDSVGYASFLKIPARSTRTYAATAVANAYLRVFVKPEHFE
jgi:hypothetical protein